MEEMECSRHVVEDQEDEWDQEEDNDIGEN